ncbi:MAG: hypothetical protein WCP97_06245 [bacterium]
MSRTSQLEQISRIAKTAGDFFPKVSAQVSDALFKRTALMEMNARQALQDRGFPANFLPNFVKPATLLAFTIGFGCSSLFDSVDSTVSRFKEINSNESADAVKTQLQQTLAGELGWKYSGFLRVVRLAACTITSAVLWGKDQPAFKQLLAAGIPNPSTANAIDFGVDVLSGLSLGILVARIPRSGK